ncbi:site-specific integrase [Psychroflexus salinarum]|uniref:Site-specific integrase n=1 Tax=Psychroflexus salinarum TaxID=546024 RepID=A0ABW3GVU0_9FLAO
MRTKHTFSTMFWQQTTRAVNNEAGIYLRITVDGKRLNVSLKRRIPIDLWDAKSKKAKGASAKAKQINQYLDEVKNKVFQIYQELKYRDQLITAQIIKAKFTGEDEQSKTLLELMAYHSKKIENSLAAGSIRNFGVTENYIKKFMVEHKKTKDVYLKQLDFQFLIDFENYLSNVWPVGHPRAMSQNTTMKHLQRLRKMITLAYHLEWIDRDPFVRWKPVYEKKVRDYLSETELAQLEDFDFNNDRLDRVRDLFIFSCYTGISYIDIMNLTRDNVVKGLDGGNWIITRRQKTKSSVKVPLLEKAENIIQKYESHPMTEISSSLLPLITNEKLNVYLKEVASHVGIRKNLTFHMARHTFATTVTLSNGVPIETVSKLLGHTKIATTQIYARVLETKVSKDMEFLKEKLKRKSSQPEKLSRKI